MRKTEDMWGKKGYSIKNQCPDSIQQNIKPKMRALEFQMRQREEEGKHEMDHHHGVILSRDGD